MTPLASIGPTQYRKQLHKYLLSRLRNPRDIDDLVQDVWERVVRLSDTKTIEKPLQYIYGIASHILADHCIEADKHRNVITDNSEIAEEWLEQPVFVLPDDKEERLNLQQQLDSAIAQLPPTHRAVLLAHKRDGLSYEECAQKLGLSIHTIEKYVTQAKTRLRLISWDR